MENILYLVETIARKLSSLLALGDVGLGFKVLDSKGKECIEWRWKVLVDLMSCGS
jgi:hypothetical protein